ncbi:hypothetical protein L0F63_005255 [Massospora cicadina]|nr:hypothetical protein L0F63_005255 [Massospora cicadina]
MRTFKLRTNLPNFLHQSSPHPYGFNRAVNPPTIICSQFLRLTSYCYLTRLPNIERTANFKSDKLTLNRPTMPADIDAGPRPLSFNVEPNQPLPKFERKHLVPREETQALAFIRSYPEFDGRDTVVAILDTGVDPAAAGLQVTSDGKPKVIDMVDCTGSGDVVIDKGVVKATTRVGQPLREVRETNCRLQYNRHAALIEKVRSQLADLPSTENKKGNSGPDGDKANKELREELEAQIEVLNELMAQFKKDDGPVVDVVVFHDGTSHRVAVDWSAAGEMGDSKALADYVLEREYWPLNYHQPPYELLNISVKVYDEGGLISLVSSAGTHATHVAGILASYHPDEPQLNGVAPGAQIISLKIGDTRLGSMETQVGLTRAVAVMAQHKCDLANMSYGEDAKLPNKGRFVKWLQDEIIRRHNCIFVSSAGNSGPALTTCGAPGGTSSDVIGVGAYVNHSMMRVEYSALEFSPEMAYSWSSRAPTADGDSGVDVYAPGGAVTSVPTYSLHKSQLMNGTSMASPNLCGCLALLVSGLKREKAAFTAYRILRAVKNTAKPFPERSNHDKASSAGIVQVGRAWDHVCRFKDHPDLDTSVDIAILNQKKNRGIYLREFNDTQAPFFATVQLTPRFLADGSPVFGNDVQLRKYELEMYLALSSTAPFISHPEVVAYNNAGRSFTVKVDPTHLEPGRVHYGEVQAWDSTCPAKGPIIQIPVTVIKPQLLDSPRYHITHEVSPGSLLRRFIAVPADATYCDMEVVTKKPSHSPSASWPISKYVLTFDPNASETLMGTGSQREFRRFRVHGGRTLEICLAQFWANTGDQAFEVTFEFHGVHSTPGSSSAGPLLMDGGATTHRVDLVSKLRREPKVNFGISLNRLQKWLTPTKATISPLRTARDQLPPSEARLYQLIAQMETPATMRLRYPPALQKFLYDSFLDGFFVTILDAYGQPVGYDEVSPREQKLPHRGEYTVRLELNHTDPQLLETLKADMAPHVAAQFKLPKEISVGAFSHPHAPYAADFGKPISALTLERNGLVPVYLKSPSLPTNVDAKPGDILLGNLTLTGNPSDKDRVEGATLKAKLGAILKSKDKGWKLVQLQENLKAAEAFKWDTEPQAQLTRLELISRQLIALLDLEGASLPDLTEEYRAHAHHLASKILASVDDGQVREYFANPQPDPGRMPIMKASREASSLAHFTNLVLALPTPDKFTPQGLDALYASMHLHLLAQASYFEQKGWAGRALKALDAHLQTQFPYTVQARPRFEGLLKLKERLVGALGLAGVWGPYLVNYRLKALPNPDASVLG